MSADRPPARHQRDDSVERDQHDDRTDEAGVREQDAAAGTVQHEEHGGFKLGAAFFGWLVAVALTVLLAGILSAAATAVGASLNLTEAEVQREANTIGVVTGIALLIVLMIGYFAGGYVAGRMARFDGGRQGLGVWIIGLIVTIAVVVVGAAFGSEYNIFERVNVPSMPVSMNTLTVGGIVGILIILAATVLAAILGGKAGERYHNKIDRTGETVRATR